MPSRTERLCRPPPSSYKGLPIKGSARRTRTTTLLRFPRQGPSQGRFGPSGGSCLFPARQPRPAGCRLALPSVPAPGCQPVRPCSPRHSVPKAEWTSSLPTAHRLPSPSGKEKQDGGPGRGRRTPPLPGMHGVAWLFHRVSVLGGLKDVEIDRLPLHRRCHMSLSRATLKTLLRDKRALEAARAFPKSTEFCYSSSSSWLECRKLE